MAEVTIKLADNGETIDLAVDFEPKLGKDEDGEWAPTPAQSAALFAVSKLADLMTDVPTEDEVGEQLVDEFAGDLAELAQYDAEAAELDASPEV